jgi:hypothetical protein
MSTAPSLRRKYYLPLRQRGSRYTEAYDVELPVTSRQVEPDIEAYIDRHSELVKADVEIGGQLFSTTVHRLDDSEDSAFVAVDEDGLPCERAVLDQSEGVVARAYFENFISRFAYSEAIAPQQTVYLPSGFIEPNVLPVAAREHVSDAKPWHELKNYSRVVVLGEAGAGKTTLMRHLATELASRALEAESVQSVPVYIQFRRLQAKTDLSSAIHAEVFQSAQETIDGDLNALCAIGGLTLCLDGLDEILEERRRRMVDAILGFSARYPAVRIVIATRTPSYEWFFPDFNHFELVPFNERQMAEWACHKLHHRGGRAWETLFTWLHSDRDLYEIARNPLMLALLVHRYDVQGLRLPSKAEIIAEFIDALVSVWDNVRGIVRNSDLWATPFRRLSRLCRLAFRNWMGASDPRYRWPMDRGIDEKLFKDTADDTGILARLDTMEGWTFRHRALGDFLAARYVVDQNDDLASLMETTSSCDRWQQVWSLACGISLDPDHLIRRLIAQPRTDALKDVSLAIGILGEDSGAEHETLGLARMTLASALIRAAAATTITPLSDYRDVDTQVLLEPTEAGPARRFLVEQWSDVLNRMYGLKLNQSATELRTLLVNSSHHGVRTLARGLETNATYQVEIEEGANGDLLRVRFLDDLPSD